MMRRRHIPRGWKIFLLAVLAIYIVYGLWLGAKVKTVVATAFASPEKVVPNPYESFISDEYYNHMVHYSDERLLERPGERYEYLLSPLPLVVHWFTGARVWIWYEDHFYRNDEHDSGCGGASILFDLRLQNGKWRVVYSYEAP